MGGTRIDAVNQRCEENCDAQRILRSDARTDLRALVAAGDSETDEANALRALIEGLTAALDAPGDVESGTSLEARLAAVEVALAELQRCCNGMELVEDA